MKFTTPKALHAGSHVRVVAPSSPFQKGRWQRAKTFLQARAYQVTLGKAFHHQEGYLAGSDLHRARDFSEAWGSARVDAILFARGGYGASRMLPYVRLSQQQPLMMGLSDLTVLLNWVTFSAGLITVHGPVLAGEQFVELTEKKRAALFALLERPSAQFLSADTDIRLMVPGSVEGRLCGGNLSMIEASLGTPYEVDLANRMVFLEEVKEPRYRIDRMLTHLSHAGKLKKVKGILLGDFTDEKGRPHQQTWLVDVVKTCLGSKPVPIVAGVAAGHVHSKVLLPLGGWVTLDRHGLVLPPLVRAS